MVFLDKNLFISLNKRFNSHKLLIKFSSFSLVFKLNKTLLLKSLETLRGHTLNNQTFIRVKSKERKLFLNYGLSRQFECSLDSLEENLSDWFEIFKDKIF